MKHYTKQTIDYLQSVQANKRMQSRLASEVKRLEPIASSPACTKGQRKRLTECMGKLTRASEDYINAYTTIIDQINSMDGTVMDREILTMRYIDGLSFAQIADRLRVDKNYVYNGHYKAINMFYKKFLNSEN